MAWQTKKWYYLNKAKPARGLSHDSNTVFSWEENEVSNSPSLLGWLDLRKIWTPKKTDQLQLNVKNLNPRWLWNLGNSAVASQANWSPPPSRPSPTPLPNTKNNYSKISIRPQSNSVALACYTKQYCLLQKLLFVPMVDILKQVCGPQISSANRKSAKKFLFCGTSANVDIFGFAICVPYTFSDLRTHLFFAEFRNSAKK